MWFALGYGEVAGGQPTQANELSAEAAREQASEQPACRMAGSAHIIIKFMNLFIHNRNFYAAVFCLSFFRGVGGDWLFVSKALGKDVVVVFYAKLD